MSKNAGHPLADKLETSVIQLCAFYPWLVRRTVD